MFLTQLFYVLNYSNKRLKNRYGKNCGLKHVQKSTRLPRVIEQQKPNHIRTKQTSLGRQVQSEVLRCHVRQRERQRFQSE